jgi:hypothetical protein
MISDSKIKGTDRPEQFLQQTAIRTQIHECTRGKSAPIFPHTHTPLLPFHYQPQILSLLAGAKENGGRVSSREMKRSSHAQSKRESQNRASPIARTFPFGHVSLIEKKTIN